MADISKILVSDGITYNIKDSSAYHSRSTGDSVTVTAGSAANLEYTPHSIPNVTSAGTASYSAGVLTLTDTTLGTAISADEITLWTTNSPTEVTKKTVVTSVS